MFSAFDVSVSGLVAQRTRLAAISNNIANISTTHNEAGEAVPYQARFVTFQTDDSIGAKGAAGVKVESVNISDEEPLYRYQPGHPDAIKDGPKAGYVAYPNINMMAEFTNSLEATRAYEANIGVMEVTKEMSAQTFENFGINSSEEIRYRMRPNSHGSWNQLAGTMSPR